VNEPLYIRVAEALGRPGDPSILTATKLLRTLVAKNAIQARLVREDTWEAIASPDITLEVSLRFGPR